MNKQRHHPSGYILGWIDSNGKVHTKSIGIHSQWKPEWNALLDAKTELLLLQLDLMQQEFESNKKLPLPIIAKGLTRKDIKRELLGNNLRQEFPLNSYPMRRPNALDKTAGCLRSKGTSSLTASQKEGK